mmetsp:Transcript_26526/g.48569  ORF Transcript_26526/g.48569 Transcript_26526/m.48569 type:complete len:100 (+) Transcript_26526:54-353(+)
MQPSAQRQTALTVLALISCVTGLTIEASGAGWPVCTSGCPSVEPLEAQVELEPSNHSCVTHDNDKVTVNRMMLVGFIGLLGGGISAISSPLTAGLLLAL